MVLPREKYFGGGGKIGRHPPYLLFQGECLKGPVDCSKIIIISVNLASWAGLCIRKGLMGQKIA